MALFAWPLAFNRIRQQARNHTFGMVRNGGAKAHQGWDLEARPLTSCYAVADGEIMLSPYSTSYGNGSSSSSNIRNLEPSTPCTAT